MEAFALIQQNCASKERPGRAANLQDHLYGFRG